MDLAEFNNLTEEEQTALLGSISQSEKQIQDLTAERDSLKDGLTVMYKKIKDLNTELTETKKVNFTLARQTSVEDRKTPEEYFNLMFGGKT